MNWFKMTHRGETFDAALELSKYQNNKNLAVQLWCRDPDGMVEPYATLSTNTNTILPFDEFVAKTYSENEGICESLIADGFFVRTGESVPCGYAGPQPVLRLTAKAK